MPPNFNSIDSYNKAPQRGTAALPRGHQVSSGQPVKSVRKYDRASLFARFKYRNVAQSSEGKVKTLSQISHLLEKPDPKATPQELQMWATFQDNIFNERPQFPEWSKAFVKDARGKWV